MTHGDKSWPIVWVNSGIEHRYSHCGARFSTGTARNSLFNALEVGLEVGLNTAVCSKYLRKTEYSVVELSLLMACFKDIIDKYGVYTLDFWHCFSRYSLTISYSLSRLSSMSATEVDITLSFADTIISLHIFANNIAPIFAPLPFRE